MDSAVKHGKLRVTIASCPHMWSVYGCCMYELNLNFVNRMMWSAGILASLGSITYPAISAFVSIRSNVDTQGVMQGMVTGMRGLCNGLGPAMFGVIFYLFHVDLNDEHMQLHHNHNADMTASIRNETINIMEEYTALAPGPPFVFGAFMVALAIVVAIFIPNEDHDPSRRPSGEKKRKRNLSGLFFVYFLFIIIIT